MLSGERTSSGSKLASHLTKTKIFTTKQGKSCKRRWTEKVSPPLPTEAAARKPHTLCSSYPANCSTAGRFAPLICSAGMLKSEIHVNVIKRRYYVVFSRRTISAARG
jgi:hypothetical protein